MQDFGDSIPGHGGFTDRMDCQVQADIKCFHKMSVMHKFAITTKENQEFCSIIQMVMGVKTKNFVQLYRW